MKLHLMDNFFGFVKSSPPVTLFGICLLLFSIVTMSLSLVAYTSDIEDTEAVSWNTVMKKFTSIEFCVFEEQPQSKLVVDRGIDLTKISVAIPVTDSLKSLARNYSTLNGVISSEHLGLTVKEDSHANVSVSLMLDDRPSNGQDGHACVTLSGHRELLSSLAPYSTETCLVSEGKRVANFIGKGKNRLEVSCVNNLKYDIEFEGLPDWAVSLSEKERLQIALHLLATTCFLFTAFLVLSCMACIRGARSNLGEGYRVV